MQRTKSGKTEEGAIEWLKTTGRTILVINGKKVKIKPGQRFWAKPEEVPEAFRDTIKPLNPKDVPLTEEDAAGIDVKKLVYTAKHVGGGRYHVIDSTGKQVTDKTLQGKEAVEQLIAELSGTDA